MCVNVLCMRACVYVSLLIRIRPPQLCTWEQPRQSAHPKAQVDHPVSAARHCMHEALNDVRVMCTRIASIGVARHYTIARRAHHACNAACVPVTPTTSHGSHDMGGVRNIKASCATSRLVVGVPCAWRSVVASIFRGPRRASMYACPARTGAVAHSHSNGPGQQSRQAIWLF